MFARFSVLFALTVTVGCNLLPNENVATVDRAELEQLRQDSADLTSLKKELGEKIELLDSYRDMSDQDIVKIEVMTELMAISGIDITSLCSRNVTCNGDSVTFTVTDTQRPHRHTVEIYYGGFGHVKMISLIDTEYLE